MIFNGINTSRSLVTQEVVDIDMMFTRVIAETFVNGESGFGTTGNWAGMSVSGANSPSKQEKITVFGIIHTVI